MLLTAAMVQLLVVIIGIVPTLSVVMRNKCKQSYKYVSSTQKQQSADGRGRRRPSNGSIEAVARVAMFLLSH